jgi:hypothetical protein
MTKGRSEPGPTVSPDAEDGQARPGFKAREQVTRPRVDDRAGPSAHPPTEVSGSAYPPTVSARGMQPYGPTQAVQPSEPAQAVQPSEPAQRVQSREPTEVVNPPGPTTVDPYGGVSRANPTIIAPQAPASAPQAPGSAAATVAAIRANRPAPSRPEPSAGHAPAVAQGQPAAETVSRQPTSEILRYGPGVPASQAEVSAEQVWRTGQVPNPPRRPGRLRRLAGTAVTVLLFAAAAVLLFLRFYHAPFSVTGATFTETAQNGCAVNVTARIGTNGASGTISYEWVFTPQQQAPQPLSLSVVSGQHAAYVTVSVQGQGHGTATQKVTLRVLGPDQETISKVVQVSC